MTLPFTAQSIICCLHTTNCSFIYLWTGCPTNICLTGITYNLYGVTGIQQSLLNAFKTCHTLASSLGYPRTAYSGPLPVQCNVCIALVVKTVSSTWGTSPAALQYLKNSFFNAAMCSLNSCIYCEFDFWQPRRNSHSAMLKLPPNTSLILLITHSVEF